MAEFEEKSTVVSNSGAVRDNEPHEPIHPRWRKKWWQIGGQDVIFVSVRDDGLPSNKADFDTNSNDTLDEGVFADSRTKDVYAPIENYEGRHRFDPKATWTEEEEANLVRRVRPCFRSREFHMMSAHPTQCSLDWKVCLWACIMFFALQLDRGNINQALSDNMLSKLEKV